MRLSGFPYVTVRLTCSLCPRRGRYRLARLAQRFGAEAEMQDVVRELSADCPWQRAKWDKRPPRKYTARCMAQLEDCTLPPDEPTELRRERLVALDGGKKA